MLAYLTDPTVYAYLTDAAIALAGVLFSLACLLATKFLNVKIEGERRKVLHSAVHTWVEGAMARGVTEATEESLEELKAYLQKSSPMAYAALKPAVGVLKALATRYFRQAQTKAL